MRTMWVMPAFRAGIGVDFRLSRKSHQLPYKWSQRSCSLPTDAAQIPNEKGRFTEAPSFADLPQSCGSQP
jgi:hypothetical protein